VAGGEQNGRDGARVVDYGYVMEGGASPSKAPPSGSAAIARSRSSTWATAPPRPGAGRDGPGERMIERGRATGRREDALIPSPHPQWQTLDLSDLLALPTAFLGIGLLPTACCRGRRAERRRLWDGAGSRRALPKHGPPGGRVPGRGDEVRVVPLRDLPPSSTPRRRWTRRSIALDRGQALGRGAHEVGCGPRRRRQGVDASRGRRVCSTRAWATSSSGRRSSRA